MMSTEFTVTVKLSDPFDVVPADQVQAAVEKALRDPQAGLLGMNVQVSTSSVTRKEYTRSSAWGWLVSRGKDADLANDVLNAADASGSWKTEAGREWVEVKPTERGKYTIEVLGGGD